MDYISSQDPHEISQVPPISLLNPVSSDREAASPLLPAQTISHIPTTPPPIQTTPIFQPVTSKVTTPWSEELSVPSIHPFVPPSPVGPTVPISDSPLEIFQLFFTSELMHEIQLQTNRYAREVMGPEKYAKWTEVTVAELEAFIGFNLLMGLNPKPSLTDYWSTNSLYHYAPIADRISRDRYKDIFILWTMPPCHHQAHLDMIT